MSISSVNNEEIKFCYFCTMTHIYINMWLHLNSKCLKYYLLGGMVMSMSTVFPYSVSAFILDMGSKIPISPSDACAFKYGFVLVPGWLFIFETYSKSVSINFVPIWNISVYFHKYIYNRQYTSKNLSGRKYTSKNDHHWKFLEKPSIRKYRIFFYNPLSAWLIDIMSIKIRNKK